MHMPYHWRITCCWALLLHSLFSPHAYAGAWTQKENARQLITSATFYKAPRYFSALGTQLPQPDYHKQEFSVYGEYGLYDDVTLGAQLNLTRVYQDSKTSENSSWNLGDTELFARKRLWQGKRSVWSLQPSVTLPSPEHGHNGPNVGSAHGSAGLRASYGRNFNAFGNAHYADISIAYVYRLGRPANQVKLDATAGLKVSERWQVIPQLFVTKSTAPIQTTTFAQSTDDNYDLFKMQISVQYALDEKRAVQVGAFHHIAGRNTGAGSGIVFGYVRNF